MDLERFFVGERRDSNPQGCEATQRAAATEKADAESLRPTSAESS